MTVLDTVICGGFFMLKIEACVYISNFDEQTLYSTLNFYTNIIKQRGLFVKSANLENCWLESFFFFVLEDSFIEEV